MKNCKGVKKTLAASLIGLVLCMLFACSVSSDVLIGRYTNKDGIVETSFVFKDDNKIEVAALNFGVEGEYLIENGEITITYSLLGFSYDWVKSFERTGDSIFIDGIEYVKEK